MESLDNQDHLNPWVSGEPVPNELAGYAESGCSAPNRLVSAVMQATRHMDEKPSNRRPCDDVKARVKALKRYLAEDVYREFFPKRYAYPRTHYDPRVYALCELSSAEMMERVHYGQTSKVDHSPRNGIFQHAYLQNAKRNIGGTMTEEGYNELFNGTCIDRAHQMLHRLNYPTYFLDSQMFDILERTKVSKDILLEDVVFPMPSMIVMPPRGRLSFKSGSGESSEVCALSITKTLEHRPAPGRQGGVDDVDFRISTAEALESGWLSKPWSEVPEGANLQDVETVKWASDKSRLEPVLYILGVLDGGQYSVGRYPLGGATLGGLIGSLNTLPTVDAATQAYYDKIKEEEGEEALFKIQDTDRAGMRGLIEFAGKLVCFMTAKTQDWQGQDRCVREAKYKKGKLQREALWGANYIGHSFAKSLTARGYGNKSDKGDGRTLRYHWRQGHFRGQRYGKNRSKYKTGFIEPYPVNPEEGE